MAKQLTASEANLKITESVYDTLFEAQDLEGLDEYLSEDIVQHVSHEGTIQGIDQVREYFDTTFSVMSDISYELLESVADDERVVYRVEMSGVLDGDLQFGDDIIEGNGTPISWEAFSSFRFEDGLVAESNMVVDELSVLQQIGAVPEIEYTAA